ncbi:hypothetical protein GP486_007588 [Trichoglossum hirsutum]|uniref:Uncharacterized protein n=1 Tax=Trichoglossum hirsutum TaxID=265104 RepID=A0A9P8IJD0_9PEZI|nr:hypothetical protein GP486_007588 [Trichoglossum hirsutum]
MPPVRPKLSITLPRNFTFHYTDGQDPREQPTGQETEARQAPSTRPYRIRPRHRPGIVVTHPEGQSNPTLLLQDVARPTIEVPGTTASGPPHSMKESSPELAEGFLAPAPSRPRFFTPPKTPLAKILTAFDRDTSEKTQWGESNSNHGESIHRPDSACSGFSDSSNSSSDSLISFPSEGGSCTSPETEDTFAFPGYSAEKRRESRRTMPMQPDYANRRIRGRKGHGSKRVKWTEEMDNHLWKTYTLYRHDPQVTPFFVQPGGVPPLGVCCRVAREAKRSWRGQKLPLSSIEESSGTSNDSRGKQILRDVQDETNAVRTGADSPDTLTDIKSGSSTPTASSEPQKQLLASKWPGTESATRRRLRKLCKSKFSPSPQKEQLLRPRSTTPFRQSRATFSSVGWDRGRATFTRDMAYSLTTSTSATMHPDGSLAQLSRESMQRNEDWFGRPLDRPANQQSQTLQFGLGIGGFESMSTRARLGSPFDDRTSVRPPPSRGQPDSSEYAAGELKSPLTLTEPLPYTTAVKRRAQHQLEDELSPGGTDMRVNFFEELFGAPAETSHRRVRSRGFSLGDVTRGSRLPSMSTPPTMYDRMNSSQFSNLASLQALASNGQTGSPPLRLGSPFADDYSSSQRARAPAHETTTTSGLAELGRQQYIGRHSLHSLGFEPPLSIEQRLDEHNRGDRDRDDRDDSSRKRFKG